MILKKASQNFPNWEKLKIQLEKIFFPVRSLGLSVKDVNLSRKHQGNHKTQIGHQAEICFPCLPQKDKDCLPCLPRGTLSCAITVPAKRAYAPSVRRGLCAFSVSGEPRRAHHPAQITRFLLPGFAELTSGKRASAAEIPIKKGVSRAF